MTTHIVLAHERSQVDEGTYDDVEVGAWVTDGGLSAAEDLADRVARAWPNLVVSTRVAYDASTIPARPL